MRIKKLFSRRRLRRWKVVDFSESPWLQLLANELFLIDKIEPRVFHKFNHTPIVTCISDYSGSHKNSDYDVYSFLFIRNSSSKTWQRSVKKLRKEIGIDKRKISYKALNDKYKRKLLLPFLSSTDSLNGVLFTFAIHKNYKDCLLTQKEYKEILKIIPGVKIKKANLEKITRMSQLMTFLTTGLLHELHTLFWLTDDDDFVANKTYKLMTGASIAHNCKSKTNNYPHTISIHTPGNSPFKSDVLTEDLLGIPDLVAGSLSNILTNSGDLLFNQKIEGPYPYFILDENHKSSSIFDWHTKESKKLKKFLIIKHPHSDSAPNNKNEFGVKVYFPYPKNAFCKITSY